MFNKASLKKQVLVNSIQDTSQVNNLILNSMKKNEFPDFSEKIRFLTENSGFRKCFFPTEAKFFTY